MRTVVTLNLVYLIPSWLVWAEIVYTVTVARPKRCINQFKPVQQSSQKALRTYCSNIYSVQKGYVCETTPYFAYELEYDEEMLCFNKTVPLCAKVRAENY